MGRSRAGMVVILAAIAAGVMLAMRRPGMELHFEPVDKQAMEGMAPHRKVAHRAYDAEGESVAVSDTEKDTGPVSRVFSPLVGEDEDEDGEEDENEDGDEEEEDEEDEKEDEGAAASDSEKLELHGAQGLHHGSKQATAAVRWPPSQTCSHMLRPCAKDALRRLRACALPQLACG